MSESTGSQAGPTINSIRKTKSKVATFSKAEEKYRRILGSAMPWKANYNRELRYSLVGKDAAGLGGGQEESSSCSSYVPLLEQKQESSAIIPKELAQNNLNKLTETNANNFQIRSTFKDKQKALIPMRSRRLGLQLVAGLSRLPETEAKVKPPNQLTVAAVAEQQQVNEEDTFDRKEEIYRTLILNLCKINRKFRDSLDKNADSGSGRGEEQLPPRQNLPPPNRNQVRNKLEDPLDLIEIYKARIEAFHRSNLKWTQTNRKMKMQVVAARRNLVEAKREGKRLSVKLLKRNNRFFQ